MLPDRYTTCMLIIPQSLSTLVYVLDCGIVLFIPYFVKRRHLAGCIANLLYEHIKTMVEQKINMGLISKSFLRYFPPNYLTR